MESTPTVDYATPGFLDARVIPVPPELLAPSPRRPIAKDRNAWPAKPWRVEQWVGLLVLICAVLDLVTNHEIWQHAGFATGVVTDIKYERKGGPHAFVGYSYDVEQETIMTTQSIDDAFYQKVRLGDAVAVRVASLGPFHFSQLVDAGPQGSFFTVAAWFLTVGLAIELPSTVIRANLICNRQRELIANGLPAVAEVTRVGPISFAPRVVMKFRFVTTDGRIVIGKSFRGERIAKQPKHRRGDPVVILYDPAKPRRHEVYGLMAYTAAQVSSPTPV